MNVGFATLDDAKRAADLLAELAAGSFGQGPAKGALKGQVTVGTATATAGYADGKLVWFDPATGTFVDTGDVYVRGADGSTPATSTTPTDAQFAGPKDIGGVVRAVYVLAKSLAGLSFTYLDGGGWWGSFNPYSHGAGGVGTVHSFSQNLVTLTDNAKDWIVWVGVTAWLEVPSLTAENNFGQMYWHTFARGRYSTAAPAGSIAGGGVVMAGQTYNMGGIYTSGTTPPVTLIYQVPQWLSGTLTFPILLKRGFTNPTVISVDVITDVALVQGSGVPSSAYRMKVCTSALAVPGDNVVMTNPNVCQAFIDPGSGWNPPAGGSLADINPDFVYESHDDGSGTAALVTFTYVEGGPDAATTWDWDFGDGGTDNVRDPVHTYSTLGPYSVTLVVDLGLPSEETVTKSIEATL
jgi:hypothetical protein